MTRTTIRCRKRRSTSSDTSSPIARTLSTHHELMAASARQSPSPAPPSPPNHATTATSTTVTLTAKPSSSPAKTQIVKAISSNRGDQPSHPAGLEVMRQWWRLPSRPSAPRSPDRAWRGPLSNSSGRLVCGHVHHPSRRPVAPAHRPPAGPRSHPRQEQGRTQRPSHAAGGARRSNAAAGALPMPAPPSGDERARATRLGGGRPTRSAWLDAAELGGASGTTIAGVDRAASCTSSPRHTGSCAAGPTPAFIPTTARRDSRSGAPMTANALVTVHASSWQPRDGSAVGEGASVTLTVDQGRPFPRLRRDGFSSREQGVRRGGG